MLNDLLPQKFVLLLFGVTDENSERAKQVLEKYESRISDIITNAFRDYIEKNPEDKAVMAVLTVAAGMFTGEQPKDKLEEITDEQKQKYSELLQEADKQVANYNALLIDGQTRVLTSKELARIQDYLNKASKLSDIDTDKLRQQIEVEFPEFRTRIPEKDLSKMPEKQSAKTEVEKVTEEADVATGDEVVEQSVPASQVAALNSLEEIATGMPQGQKDISMGNSASDNPQVGSAPVDSPPQPAATVQQNDSEGHNIVDQAMPKDETLEDEIAPKLDLGGNRGGQPI